MRPTRATVIGLIALAVVALALVFAAVLKPSVVQANSAAEAVNANSVPLVTPTAAPTVAFIGDSYTAGAGAEIGAGWVDDLAKAKGWRAVNLGRGGTGYLTAIKDPAVAHKACNLDFCPNYDGMIQDAVKANPDIVIVAGGRNDGATLTPALQTAVDTFYKDLRAALPKTRIVALSPIWGANPQPDHAAFKDEVKAAATSVGAEYIDIGEPLATHPEMIIADGIHPDTAGHALLAQVISAAIH